MADTLLISVGDVIEVQLTSETVVIESAQGRQAEQGRITNRMRLFIAQTDGKEAKFDFEDTELGVRETQRVAVVRARLKQHKEPVNLILFNLSSGEKDCFEPGLGAYLGRKPLLGPAWQAGGLSVLVMATLWALSNLMARDGQGAAMSIHLAILFALLAYPVFWRLLSFWDRISERMRYKKARRSFIAEMEARMRVYAPNSP